MDDRAVDRERRRTEERRVRRSLHYPERRRGFARRRADHGPMSRRYHEALDSYRRSPAKVGIVLAVFLVLNLADLLVTLRALDLGAVEANPVMAALFEADLALAAVFKLTIGIGVAAGLWWLRRYRRALELSLVMVAAFTLVVLYGTAGVISLSV